MSIYIHFTPIGNIHLCPFVSIKHRMGLGSYKEKIATKSRKSGNVINIASVLGIIPARLQSGFTAAKAGVINFSKSMALELGPLGIRVNAIAPGSILTRGTRELFYNPDKVRYLPVCSAT
jgi:NAD(P)-dependent dehydrogenase (short-subunit alcohol dehydrogenase family)